MKKKSQKSTLAGFGKKSSNMLNIVKGKDGKVKGSPGGLSADK